jgi:hypothetical protein
MPRVSASRELLASQEDAWRFVAEPYHFADWWPGLSGVHPDRHGFAEGARWQVFGSRQPTLFRRAAAGETMLVRAVRAPERFAWTLTRSRLDGELRLVARGPDRTLATLDVDAPWLLGLGRTLPKRALGRLHELCQTGAEP